MKQIRNLWQDEGDEDGKMMILTFEDGEDEIMNQILLTLKSEQIVCHSIPKIRCSRIDFRDFTIDLDRRRVEKEGTDVNLTATEFEILRLLAQNPGMVFSKEQIYDAVWQEPYAGDYSNVISHVHNIREKIEDIPSQPVYIQTVWGIGYRFNQNVSNGLEQ